MRNSVTAGISIVMEHLIKVVLLFLELYFKDLRAMVPRGSWGLRGTVKASVVFHPCWADRRLMSLHIPTHTHTHPQLPQFPLLPAAPGPSTLSGHQQQNTLDFLFLLGIIFLNNSQLHR